jgi:hypothetical protein
LVKHEGVSAMPMNYIPDRLWNVPGIETRKYPKQRDSFTFIVDAPLRHFGLECVRPLEFNGEPTKASPIDENIWIPPIFAARWGEIFVDLSFCTARVHGAKLGYQLTHPAMS